MSSLPRSRLVLVSAVVAAVLAVAAIYFVPFRGTRESGGSECRALPVAASIPSVAMDQERGVAYLAYVDSPKKSAGRAPRGTIMLMDLNLLEPQVRAALVTDPPDFQPVTVSLYAPPQGPRRLFVIDRESAVQIFEQSPSGAFEKVKTVRDSQFANLTEIVPAGAESFYVRGQPRGWFGLSKGSVMFYDGAKATAAPKEALKPAHDGAGVYVNAKASKRLEVLDRNGQTELQVCPTVVTPSS